MSNFKTLFPALKFIKKQKHWTQSVSQTVKDPKFGWERAVGAVQSSTQTDVQQINAFVIRVAPTPLESHNISH